MSDTADYDAPVCRIVCITTDDKGRGYWCPDCPERVIPPAVRTYDPPLVIETTDDIPPDARNT